ncbi:MAG: DUF3426 domain-containing protein [Candidatus Binataceae bacterium]|jgi:predicted Zn finger-like uncharacterized protein
MIEIQCTSCLTRYRIEPSLVSADRPTFKCSRCGHVFSADPRRAKTTAPSGPSLKRADPQARTKADAAESSRETRPPRAAEEPNPLARSFAEHDDFKPGENLSFDFGEDFGPASEPVEPPSEPAPEKSWQVGTIEPDAEPALTEGPSAIADAGPPSPVASDAPRPRDEAVARETVRQPAAAPSARAGQTYSSGPFLIVFLMVLAAFTALSVMASNEPAASRDLLGRVPELTGYFAQPAPVVAVQDLHAEYQRLKDNRSALMISGRAENVSQRPLHAVKVAIDLLDPSQKGLAQQAVYWGSQTSPRMVAEMTPRELEFLGKLDPPRNFVVNPGQSSSFLAVFIDPPAHLHSFRITVVDAQAPEGSDSPRT